MLHDSSYDRSERGTRNSDKYDAAFANGLCHIMRSNNALGQRITGQIFRILMLFIDLLGKTFAAHPETHPMAISRDDIGNHRTETTAANDCYVAQSSTPLNIGIFVILAADLWLSPSDEARFDQRFPSVRLEIQNVDPFISHSLQSVTKKSAKLPLSH